MATSNPQILEANGVTLNVATGEVISEGVPVHLSTIERGILECLMRSAGQLVTTEAMARHLAEREVNALGGELDLHVNTLRQKLERGRRLIRRIAGTGYIFERANENAASEYRLA